MAKYNVTHTCGHTETHNISGPYKTRDTKAEWYASRICSECWKKEQEEKKAREQEDAKTASADLPQLTGSEKQIAWAIVIRHKILNAVKSSASFKAVSAQRPELAECLWSELLNKPSAKFWIDHKDISIEQEYAIQDLLREIGKPVLENLENK